MTESTPSREDFGGAKIAAFESRRQQEMHKLIESAGGLPFVSPSMREVPIADNPAAIEFAGQLMTGQVDVVIFLTGVGFESLLAAVDRRVDHARFISSLTDITTIVRGPKPLAAMRKAGIEPTLRVGEPNTWREILSTVDQQLAIANQSVVIQEYGVPNPSLLAGLEARGARVRRLVVYRWDLPLELAPLKENVKAICARQRDLALFTSAQQVRHLIQVAGDMDCESQLRESLAQTVIGSIGPTTTEALRAAGLAVDFEPTRPKLGILVNEVATASQQLMARKRAIRATLSGPLSSPTDSQAPWHDSPFLKACRLEPTAQIPIWLMRQAGRYLPEYRQIREQFSFIELCKRPDLCAEIMVSTVQRLGVDAAIIFSDLLPILEPMGLELEYLAGDGPVIHNPVRDTVDIDRVFSLESVDSLDFVIETVRQTRRDLPADIPLIGFAGAPFTLASYVIEGGASRNYLHTKTLMRRDESAWRELMSRFARSIALYLNAQIRAGAQCVQLFDSWVGCLGVEDYRRYVLPYVRDVIVQLDPGVPVISFATGNPALLPCLAEAKPAVVGVDWRIPLDEAWRTVGYHYAVQGNLDPTVLLGDRAQVRKEALRICRQAMNRPGHIFNLGHGVLPQTPVENVLALIRVVQGYRAP